MDRPKPAGKLGFRFGFGLMDTLFNPLLTTMTATIQFFSAFDFLMHGKLLRNVSVEKDILPLSDNILA